uniref:Putative secreted protein n=1 Tax=Panstrongylus lignarius TaxID=156445 RepID=A0A224Y2J0_9HEMI
MALQHSSLFLVMGYCVFHWQLFISLLGIVASGDISLHNADHPGTSFFVGFLRQRRKNSHTSYGRLFGLLREIRFRTFGAGARMSRWKSLGYVLFVQTVVKLKAGSS